MGSTAELDVSNVDMAVVEFFVVHLCSTTLHKLRAHHCDASAKFGIRR